MDFNQVVVTHEEAYPQKNAKGPVKVGSDPNGPEMLLKTAPGLQSIATFHF